MYTPFEIELISIITPSHNSSKFISDTIESVLAQTYKNWEMIIVDDCSNDNSVAIIKKYMKRDRRIKLIQLEKNSSPAVARNMAIAEAKGRYIAFLDSDDIWLPEKLEKQKRFMSENNVALSYSSYYIINAAGAQIGLFITKEKATYDELLKTSYIGTLTAIYDAGDRIGKRYMEENIGLGEDYILWLKILKEGGVARGILEPLAKYRLQKNSISANKLKAAYWRWHIYRNIEKLNLPKSLYFFIYYFYYGLIKHLIKYRREFRATIVFCAVLTKSSKLRR